MDESAKVSYVGHARVGGVVKPTTGEMTLAEFRRYEGRDALDELLEAGTVKCGNERYRRVYTLAAN